VRRACECNELFAYGELLDVANVRTLEKTSAVHWRTVLLFAYGTYDKYIRKPQDYLTFNETMLRKLRQLTILSMVAESNNARLTYTDLLSRLQLHTAADLESLITDAVYKSVFSARFDPANGYVRFTHCMGRDVDPLQLPAIAETLTAFMTNCDNVLGDVDTQMTLANEKNTRLHEQQCRLNEEYEGVKKAAQLQQGGGRTPDDVNSDNVSTSLERPSARPQPQPKRYRNTTRQQQQSAVPSLLAGITPFVSSAPAPMPSAPLPPPVPSLGFKSQLSNMLRLNTTSNTGQPPSTPTPSSSSSSQQQ